MTARRPAALAAAAIRKDLKIAGIKVDSVRSRSYAGGESVTVQMTDSSPDDYERAEQIAAPYQYGHYDIGDDLYRADNRNDDIPQAQFVRVENWPSPAMLERIRAYAALHLDDSETVGVFAWEARIFNGSLGDFWGSEFNHAIGG